MATESVKEKEIHDCKKKNIPFLKTINYSILVAKCFILCHSLFRFFVPFFVPVAGTITTDKREIFKNIYGHMLAGNRCTTKSVGANMRDFRIKCDS